MVISPLVYPSVLFLPDPGSRSSRITPQSTMTRPGLRNLRSYRTQWGRLVVDGGWTTETPPVRVFVGKTTGDPQT